MLPILFSLAALAFGARAFDAPDDSRALQQPGLLRFPIRGINGGNTVKNLTKRQTDVGLETPDMGRTYAIDITLGTPGQTVSVQFDTGSDELWVNPICETASDPEQCYSGGQFTDSSTFVDLEEQGYIPYGSGWVEFEYGYDYVEIGPIRISQQVFGVATNSDFVSLGIMGAGPSLMGWENEYPLVIDSLAEKGFTNSRAFSLDLRSIDSDRGSVVFGGLDTKKYTGPLEKLPIVPAEESPDGATRYWVNLNGIAVSLANGDDITVFKDGIQTVLLDSGYSISALPSAIFSQLVEAFPSAEPIPGSNMWSVDCSLVDTEGTVDFTFGETVINVPYADWIWQQETVCILGAFEDNEFPVLGDTFLRAAYVVYDWDNRNIHLANNEDCGTNLVAIESGPDAVPSIEGECGATPTETSSTSKPPTSTSTSTSKPPSSTTSGWGNSTTTSHPPPNQTSTISSTKTYTITSCPPTVTDCPIGSLTTEVVTKTTTYCPETTATYTLPTHTCDRDVCHGGPQPTGPPVVTVRPHPTNSKPTKVPHCTTCAPPPDVTGPPPSVTFNPPPVFTPTDRPGNATTTGGPAPPVPTAGAAKVWAAAPGGVVALGLGAAVAGLL